MQTHWKFSFSVLWCGQAASILTSSISQYALVWYLSAATGSPAVLSMAMLCAMLPQGVLCLITGSFADRFDRKALMMLSDGAIGLVSLGLALSGLSGPLPIPLILAALALRSVGAAFHTPCIQAVTPLIVPQDMLAKCAGWSQGIQTVSLLVSPALAAVLYDALPLPAVILLDTLGALAAVLSVLLARLPSLHTGAAGQPFRLWADTREGFQILRSHRWLWELCLICALFSVAFLPVSALFPLMSLDYFGRDTAAAALVETAFSLGMLAGSVILGLWGGTRDKMVTMTASIFTLGFLLIATGLLPPTAFAAFVVLSFFMSLCAPFFSSLFMALIQQKVEGEYLGRVLSLSSAIMTLASPIGLAATALFTRYTGLTLWFVVAGLITLLCGVLCIAMPAVRRCGRD